ncbi:UDP-N-acetylmuramoyl-L-alanyl-D-glutamate--2,6-diaminopimelate ligase [Nocardia sp. NPDC050697]|uniref:Mur ligase family protein n=1 Tax=Nocardia sp. NPDC050697 TaxID=3155158 RepID=UPI0033D2C85E
MPVTLEEIARDLRCPLPPGAGAGLVTGVAADSRAVRPGTLWFALPGRQNHGLDFEEQARRRGAVAVVSDRPARTLPTLVTAAPRAALGPLAARLHGHPSRHLPVFGVTGTNGKTSTTYLLDAGLAGAGIPSGLLGGIVARTPARSEPATRTTPEADVIARHLARCRADGARAAVLEVSSHGLTEHRVDGTHFACAAFTGLARDHLDHHGSMERYFAAKAALFDPARSERAVIAVDDAWGLRLAGQVRLPTVTCGTTPGTAADWRATDIRAELTGTRFRAHGPGGSFPVRLRLLGTHQARNALTALAVLAGAGIDPEAAAAGMAELGVVPGRLERVDAGQDFLAFVDYAHNEDGQRAVLAWARSRTAGRLIVVIGATGDRDAGKRAALGRTAAHRADLVVVTDESPERESASELRHQVLAGAAGGETVEIADRAAAIRHAIAAARPGDLVLLAGRGADTVQRYATATRHFDDRAELAAALAEHRPQLSGPAAIRTGDGSSPERRPA